MLYWEKILELLRRQGWSYGYGKCLDKDLGGEVYLVNLRRGDKRLSIKKPTMAEAVKTISRLAQKEP